MQIRLAQKTIDAKRKIDQLKKTINKSRNTSDFDENMSIFRALKTGINNRRTDGIHPPILSYGTVCVHCTCTNHTKPDNGEIEDNEVLVPFNIDNGCQYKKCLCHEGNLNGIIWRVCGGPIIPYFIESICRECKSVFARLYIVTTIRPLLFFPKVIHYPIIGTFLRM